jgi:hypothetical protein
VHLVANDDWVKLRSDFLNKKLTTSSASFVLRSAQTFSFGARKAPVSCPLDRAKLVLTRLMKGSVGVMTKQTKAIAAEASTQCFLAVENMLFGRV